MANFLEQLVAEWYEFRGYFVRRNINVGPRARGSESELDVVAFHPTKRHLVHIEPSMDAHSWKREADLLLSLLLAGNLSRLCFADLSPYPKSALNRPFWCLVDLHTQK